MTTARSLAEALLRDRIERIARKPIRKAATTPEREFDPFANTRWRVIAGGDPGYLVKTPMRRGPVGWFIPCRACAVEFESKGWAYCPTCMALPAQERRDSIPSPTIAPQDETLPAYPASASNAFNASYRVSASENAQKSEVLIGPSDFPINIVGGFRWPEAKPSPLGRVRVRPWIE